MASGYGHAGAGTAPSAPATGPSWEDMIRAVIDARAPLDLVAQPIVDLGTGDIAGYELLSRFGWPYNAHDLSATPSPDRWFVAARRLGLGAELTLAVLRRALDLRHSLPDGLFCTINVDPDLLLAPVVRDLLESTDLERVVIELTEHSGAESTEELLAALDALRDRGALVAVDDAGSGYAGLNQLLAVRPEIVKLDRRLTADVDRDQRRKDLVSTVHELCIRLGSVLVAEGVETQAECEALVRFGVPLGQGWFLGAPAAPWQEVRDDLRQWIQAVTGRVRADDSVAPLVRPFGDASGGHELPRVWLVGRSASGHHSIVWRGAHGDLLTAPATVISSRTPLRVALRRALARPAEHCWAPLAVADTEPVSAGGGLAAARDGASQVRTGEVIGWVDMADLVRRATGIAQLPGEGAAEVVDGSPHEDREQSHDAPVVVDVSTAYVESGPGADPGAGAMVLDGAGPARSHGPAGRVAVVPRPRVG